MPLEFRDNTHNEMGSGSPAMLVRACAMNPADPISAYRALAPLPLHSEEMIDRIPVKVGRERLALFAAVLNAGLTIPIPNWLGRSELYWEETSDEGSAQESMNPSTRGESAMPDRKGARIPIFCTTSRFGFSIREMTMAQLNGAPLDVTEAENCMRRMNERFEETLINGSVVKSNGLTVPGILNAPNASSLAYGSNLAWDDPTKTGPAIKEDVLGMVDLLQAQRMYGPYELWLNTKYNNRAMNRDYHPTYSTDSVRQALEMMDNGAGGKLKVNVADRIPVNRTIMLQMTSNVLDIGVGQEPAMISWQDGPKFDFNYLILGCMIPRVKTTYTGQSGIVIGYPT